MRLIGARKVGAVPGAELWVVERNPHALRLGFLGEEVVDEVEELMVVDLDNPPIPVTNQADVLTHEDQRLLHHPTPLEPTAVPHRGRTEGGRRTHRPRSPT